VECAKSAGLVLHVSVSVGVREQRNIIRIIQTFQGRQEGPPDASGQVFCGTSQHPVDDYIEEKCQHHASLLHTGLDRKTDVTVPYTAGKVMVEDRVLSSFAVFFFNFCCTIFHNYLSANAYFVPINREKQYFVVINRGTRQLRLMCILQSIIVQFMIINYVLQILQLIIVHCAIINRK